MQAKYGSEDGSVVSESFTDVSTTQRHERGGSVISERPGNGSAVSDRAGHPERPGSVVSDRAGSVVSDRADAAIPVLSSKEEAKLIKRKKEQHRDTVCLSGYPDLTIGQLTKEAKKVPGMKHVFQWKEK
jgi:hypothetical protein